VPGKGKEQGSRNKRGKKILGRVNFWDNDQKTRTHCRNNHLKRTNTPTGGGEETNALQLDGENILEEALYGEKGEELAGTSGWGKGKIRATGRERAIC